jgi:hypothetical protein
MVLGRFDMNSWALCSEYVHYFIIIDQKGQESIYLAKRKKAMSTWKEDNQGG